MTDPVISIITSTYNGSHILYYAIHSVIHSTFSDWEMIIIGDHCVDDTESIIGRFNDARIRFTNLASNSGQQATPSNIGLSQLRGRYVCYLNQDDMYFPWHLDYMLETITATGVDILCAGHAVIDSVFEKDGAIEVIASNGPIARRNAYSPLRWYLASSWFMTVEAARDVGRWKLEHELIVAPSQEWMFRAWKMKKRIYCPSEISLLLILSGKRNGSYRKRDNSLHAAVYENLIHSEDPRKELGKALGNGARARPRGLRQAMRWAYDNAIGRPSMMLGIHPDTLHRIVRFGARRGGGVRHWQRTVELESRR